MFSKTPVVQKYGQFKLKANKLMSLFSFLPPLLGSPFLKTLAVALPMWLFSHLAYAETLVGKTQSLTDTPLSELTQTPKSEEDIDDLPPHQELATPKLGPILPIDPIISAQPLYIGSTSDEINEDVLKFSPAKLLSKPVINVNTQSYNPLLAIPKSELLPAAAPKAVLPRIRPMTSSVLDGVVTISKNTFNSKLAPEFRTKNSTPNKYPPLFISQAQEATDGARTTPALPATEVMTTPVPLPPKRPINPQNCPAGWEKEICVYANLVNFIKQKYAYDIDTGIFLKEATKRAIGSLDRHAQYFDPEGFKEMLDGRHGDFAGVGLTVGSENGVLRVHDVLEEGPSNKAGIKANDLISEINGKSLSPLTFKEAIKLLRGQPKSEVIVTVVRPPQNKVLRLKIVRDIIVTSKVKYRIFKNDYAWIRIPSFTDRTLPQLVEALKSLDGDRAQKNLSPIKGLVLDVRQNGGGGLQTAVGVAAAFLPADVSITKIVSLDDNRKERTDILTANPVHYRLSPNEADHLKDLPAFTKTVPMVVLINETSASASELTAAALRDHGRAVIMGKNSFGKGSVQTIVSIGENEGGGAIKLTTAHYYSPSGKAINGWGVAPDVEVDQYAHGEPNELLNYRELDFPPGEYILKEDAGMKIIRERREKARATFLQELADRKKKGVPDPPEPKPVKFGEDSDYMLMQTINYFQQKPIHKNFNTAPQIFVYKKNGGGLMAPIGTR